jgi:uncharacterized protein
MPESSFATRYAQFVVKNRWIVVILLFAWAIVSAFYVKDVNLRNDPDSLLPLTNRYIATNLYSDQHFGMGNIMVWGIKVKEGDIFQPWFIEMLIEMYGDFSSLDFAKSENFLGLPSTKARNLGLSENGSLDLSRLIPSNGLAEDKSSRLEQVAFLKTGIQRHPVLEPLLVYYEDQNGNKCEVLDDEGKFSKIKAAHTHASCQAKATFILGDFENELKDDSLAWIAKTKSLLEDYERRYGDRVEFLTSGEPYFLASMIEEIWDKAFLFAISLLIILFVLYYEFRHWSCSVLPLVGVGITIVMTLGLMGFTQFKLTTMMILTPVLLLAIGIGHSMQITRRFMQELHKHGEAEIAAVESIRHTIVPAFLSIGTDLHGFFAISFVDISFYKAYAYFGIYGMATLIFTTTTLIPLLLMIAPPKLHDHEDERSWENYVGTKLTNLLTGRMKWIPLLMLTGIIWASVHYTELGRGISSMMAGESGRSDPEVARIQDQFDIMPGVEKGIHYPRAAFKEHYLLGDLFGEGEVKPIADLNKISEMMPGVISANIIIRSRDKLLPACGPEARNEDDERILGPDQCYDDLEDPPQGIFNDAEVVKALSDFEDELRRHPNIGFTSSYVQFLKTMNMVLNTPLGQSPIEHANLYAIPSLDHMAANRYAYEDPDDPEYFPSPNTTINLYNGIFDNNTESGELDSFINTADWNEGLIVAFINTMEPDLTHQIIRDIQRYLIEHRNDPGMDKLKFGIEAGEEINVETGIGVTRIITEDTLPEGHDSIGGFLGITEATRDVAFEEWLHAPAMTSVTVFLMTAIMFRSWLIAFLLIGLCAITLMTQYGLAGYMTSIKEWSGNLAFHVQVALSISMGLGVDYAVYIISRLREEMECTGLDWKRALQNTISSTGGSILISVIVLLGSLIPLMNTSLANTWSISLYIAEALILDVFTSLLLLPLIIYWLKPSYVFDPTSTRWQ